MQVKLFCQQFSLIERISKQQLLATYYNDVFVHIKSLQCVGKLPVRLCATNLQSPMFAHFSALLFRQFSKNAETTRSVVVTLQYTVVEKKLKPQLKAVTSTPATPNILVKFDDNHHVIYCKI